MVGPHGEAPAAPLHTTRTPQPHQPPAPDEAAPEHGEPDRALREYQRDLRQRPGSAAWAMKETARQRRPSAPVTCPSCGYAPTEQAECGRLGQDIKVSWIEPVPTTPAACSRLGTATGAAPPGWRWPISIAPLAIRPTARCWSNTGPRNCAATGEVPALVQRVLAVRHWRAVPGVGMMCPDHPQ
ncbi:hypothetical protein [Nocardia sp. XZ_19_385]|uniref:hypothetical protein n=1 Tax=Nocardia sp. XZ_19_385 TaxID=2769488 RepID=UPI00188E1F2E